MKLVLLIIGVVLFIEGFPYFASPKSVKKMMAEVHQLENSVLRIVGFAAMAGGLLMVWLSTTRI